MAYGQTLDTAFTHAGHAHGLPLRDAWDRRYSKRLKRQEEQIQKDLKYKAQRQYMRDMEAGLAETGGSQLLS